MLAVLRIPLRKRLGYGEEYYLARVRESLSLKATSTSDRNKPCVRCGAFPRPWPRHSLLLQSHPNPAIVQWFSSLFVAEGRMIFSARTSPSRTVFRRGECFIIRAWMGSPIVLARGWRWLVGRLHFCCNTAESDKMVDGRNYIAWILGIYEIGGLL